MVSTPLLYLGLVKLLLQATVEKKHTIDSKATYIFNTYLKFLVYPTPMSQPHSSAIDSDVLSRIQIWV